jgi:hypothetical protein
MLEGNLYDSEGCACRKGRFGEGGGIEESLGVGRRWVLRMRSTTMRVRVNMSETFLRFDIRNAMLWMCSKSTFCALCEYVVMSSLDVI